MASVVLTSCIALHLITMWKKAVNVLTCWCLCACVKTVHVSNGTIPNHIRVIYTNVTNELKIWRWISNNFRFHVVSIRICWPRKIDKPDINNISLCFPSMFINFVNSVCMTCRVSAAKRFGSHYSFSHQIFYPSFGYTLPIKLTLPCGTFHLIYDSELMEGGVMENWVIFRYSAVS